VIKMSVQEKEEAQVVTKSDLQYIEDRLTRAWEDRQRIRKSIRTIIAVLVDKKLVGENVARAFMESKKENTEKILEWFVEAKKLAIKKKDGEKISPK